MPTRLVGDFWVQVSDGADHGCALSVNGGSFCWGEGHDQGSLSWGWNLRGQLGLGNEVERALFPRSSEEQGIGRSIGKASPGWCYSAQAPRRGAFATTRSEGL